jgi:hypothetical protein
MEIENITHVLTNKDIERVNKKLNLNIRNVIFKSQLDSNLSNLDITKSNRNNFIYIVNLDDEYNTNGMRNNGTHYVVLFIKRHFSNTIHNYKILYFDPFGIKCPEIVKKMCNKYFKGCPFYNTTQMIQPISSQNCGWYCIFCIYYVQYRSSYSSIYKAITEFINLFKDLNTNRDEQHNKNVLEHWIKSNKLDTLIN